MKIQNVVFVIIIVALAVLSACTTGGQIILDTCSRCGWERVIIVENKYYCERHKEIAPVEWVAAHCRGEHQ